MVLLNFGLKFSEKFISQHIKNFKNFDISILSELNVKTNGLDYV